MFDIGSGESIGIATSFTVHATHSSSPGGLEISASSGNGRIEVNPPIPRHGLQFRRPMWQIRLASADTFEISLAWMVQVECAWNMEVR